MDEEVNKITESCLVKKAVVLILCVMLGIFLRKDTFTNLTIR